MKSIKDWAIDDRPREKMLEKGPSALSNAELLAILIGSGSQEKSAVELMRDVMRTCDDKLETLGHYTIAELCGFKGIGEAKAVTIMASVELGKRRLQEMNSKTVVSISSPDDIYKYMGAVMSELDHEEFWCIMLNNAHRIISRKMISSGGMSETTVDVRMIMREALLSKSCAIVLVHNHPSGNISPSTHDFRITSKIKEACDLMGIRLLDHLVYTDNSYYSMANEGRL